MNYNEMDAAIREAEATIRRAEEYKNKMANFLVHRLKGISVHTLKRLKSELKNFNSNTGEWKV